MSIRVKVSDIAVFSKGEQINGDELKEDGAYSYLNGGINPSGKWNTYNTEGNTIAVSEGGNSCGYVNYMESPYWCGAHCYRLTNIKGDPKYVYYALKSQEMRLMGIRSGACMPNIKKQALGEFVIAYHPDLPTQRRIAATLDKVSEGIAVCRQMLADLDVMVKARFVEMFGDTFSNPKKWPTRTFRETSLRLSDGPFGSNLKSEHYSNEGVRVIRLGNIGVGKFIDDDKSYIPYDHYQRLKKYTCQTGDIVIGTLGEPNLRACLVPEYVGIAVNKADCVHYIPKPDILDNTFVCHYINCPTTLLLASGMIHGQTRARVSSGQIAEMPVFIPPMELQIQFSMYCKQVDKSKFVVQQQLAELETLKKSLMQEYFG